jgi:hypothetical protein
MSFQHIGDLAAIQVKRSGDQRMIRSVYHEMKRLLALMDKIKGKPPAEQVALIRAHVAATAQEAASEAVGG